MMGMRWAMNCAVASGAALRHWSPHQQAGSHKILIRILALRVRGDRVPRDGDAVDQTATTDSDRRADHAKAL
jgi:hypothetical protein